MPDFSALLSRVDFSAVVLALLAIAALMAVPLAAAWGARKVLSFIDGGKPSAGDRLQAAREHAMQLQMTGEGQSEAWAEEARARAYDAGYSGGGFDSSWGIEASDEYEQAKADRIDDFEKGWN